VASNNAKLRKFEVSTMLSAGKVGEIRDFVDGSTSRHDCIGR
jgi:hypothetical protein